MTDKYLVVPISEFDYVSLRESSAVIDPKVTPLHVKRIIWPAKDEVVTKWTFPLKEKYDFKNNSIMGRDMTAPGHREESHEAPPTAERGGSSSSSSAAPPPVSVPEPLAEVDGRADVGDGVGVGDPVDAGPEEPVVEEVPGILGTLHSGSEWPFAIQWQFTPNEKVDFQAGAY